MLMKYCVSGEQISFWFILKFLSWMVFLFDKVWLYWICIKWIYGLVKNSYGGWIFLHFRLSVGKMFHCEWYLCLWSQILCSFRCCGGMHCIPHLSNYLCALCIIGLCSYHIILLLWWSTYLTFGSRLSVWVNQIDMNYLICFGLSNCV